MPQTDCHWTCTPSASQYLSHTCDSRTPRRSSHCSWELVFQSWSPKPEVSVFFVINNRHQNVIDQYASEVHYSCFCPLTKCFPSRADICFSRGICRKQELVHAASVFRVLNTPKWYWGDLLRIIPAALWAGLSVDVVVVWGTRPATARSSAGCSRCALLSDVIKCVACKLKHVAQIAAVKAARPWKILCLGEPRRMVNSVVF